MGFTFLHTADWHIGKPFGNFSSEQQPLLRQARLDAIARIAEAAREHGAGHVIVCGDVFDHRGLADRVVAQALAAMATQSGIMWHLLPGNHDPAREGGIWERIFGMGVPRNVRVHDRPDATEIADGVMLLPAPLTTKAVALDPTAWMDIAATGTGAIRIGAAHGSTQGFGGDGLASAGIAPERRRTAQLDYLALGDWHGVKEIASGVWYSGTPEPDQFPVNQPGHALAVEICGPGAAPRVTPIAIAKYTWIKRSIKVRDDLDLAPLESEIARLGATAATYLAEVTLEGIVSLDSDARIATRLAKLEDGLFHLSKRMHALTLDVDHAAIDMRGCETQTVAERLIAMRLDPETRAIADVALRRLFQLARLGDDAR